jgi:hypothetical protein
LDIVEAVYARGQKTWEGEDEASNVCHLVIYKTVASKVSRVAEIFSGLQGCVHSVDYLDLWRFDILRFLIVAFLLDHLLLAILRCDLGGWDVTVREQ